MSDAEVIQSAYEDDLRKMYADVDQDYSLAKMGKLKVNGENKTVDDVLVWFRKGLALAREIRDLLVKEVSDVR